MSDVRRVLIAPRPGFTGGPSIALLRLARALQAAGLKTTSLPFRLFGRSLLPWQFAIMMGVPRHAERLLRGTKPVVLIMGKPEDPVESAAVGRTFTAQDQRDNEHRAATILAADHVAFISNYVVEIWRRWFQQHGKPFPDAGKWCVLYHGVDLDQFCPGPRPGSHQLFTIGCIGALRTEMRINAIYEVSRRLSFPHRLLIVGSMTAECEARLRALRSEENWRTPVERIPWISADRLVGVLHSIDCLLHPVDYEGFGIVMAEAMACGVPVVAPAQGGAGEIVPPGGATVATVPYCYDDGFFARLADGVESVHSDHGHFSRMARQTAMERFDIHVIARRFIEIADGLIASR